MKLNCRGRVHAFCASGNEFVCKGQRMNYILFLGEGKGEKMNLYGIVCVCFLYIVLTSMKCSHLYIILLFFRWSAEFGAPRTGSPELHVMIAEYLYSESPELVGLTEKACTLCFPYKSIAVTNFQRFSSMSYFSILNMQGREIP